MMIPIGYDSFIQKETVVLILPPNSSSAKRLIRSAEEGQRLFDTTSGHRTRGVLVTKDRFVILTPIQPETLRVRFNKFEPGEGKEGP